MPRRQYALADSRQFGFVPDNDPEMMWGCICGRLIAVECVAEYRKMRKDARDCIHYRLLSDPQVMKTLSADRKPLSEEATIGSSTASACGASTASRTACSLGVPTRSSAKM